MFLRLLAGGSIRGFVGALIIAGIGMNRSLCTVPSGCTLTSSTSISSPSSWIAEELIWIWLLILLDNDARDDCDTVVDCDDVTETLRSETTGFTVAVQSVTGQLFWRVSRKVFSMHFLWNTCPQNNTVNASNDWERISLSHCGHFSSLVKSVSLTLSSRSFF